MARKNKTVFCKNEMQRPKAFKMELNVDHGSGNEEDLQASAKTWKIQLLRLVQDAPRPIPVLCNTPRIFPPTGNNRISESSWTSDSTHITDISYSGSWLEAFESKNGVSENQTGNFEDSSSISSFKTASGSSPDNKVDSIACSNLKGNEDNIGGKISPEYKGKQEALPPALSSSGTSEDSNTTKQQQQDQIRNTLVLSIQGDSDYWEKFRYSKDYQSSLMIECICNEVFNLKPSPRYKSLMELSRNSKDTKQMPSLPQCNDENGIKVVEGGRTKEEEVKSMPLPFETQTSEKGENDEKVEKVGNINATRLQEDENQQQIREPEKKESYSSVSSSVFTTTTEEGEDYNSQRNIYSLLDRDKLLKGFGLAFHGYLTKRETDKLLRINGQYLIRQIPSEDGFILSFKFDGNVRNYRIKCDGTSPSGNNEPYTYYLEDRRKCYSSLDELVREGLMTVHLDENAGSYIDLLVELAQFQRNDSLLQTPPAVSPGSRKNSRVASFRMTRLTSSSSVITSGGGEVVCVDATMNANTSGNPSITSATFTERKSMEIPLLIHYFDDEIGDGLVSCQICSQCVCGPFNRGMRCRDCGLLTHELCMEKVKSECKPDPATISPFLTDLTTLVKGSYSKETEGSHGIPYVLEKCINEVEARGLNIEGLYRVSGSMDDIENLKTLFEKDRTRTDLSCCPDTHTITGLIKFFLRQLPDPLLTQDVFEKYIKKDECDLESVQTLILCLPIAHRITLKYLLEHLLRVTKEKSSNKMNAFNLSSVMMPSIIGPTNMSFSVLESATKLIRILITKVNDFKF